MRHGLSKWTVTSLAALLAVAGTSAADSPKAAAATTATINASTTYQPIDGFGFSEHFGRADIMRGSQRLPDQKQREILDLLLGRTTGAGLSILRLGIDSGIQPTDPGGPNAAPKYVWDRQELSAFRNTDGTLAVVVLNAGTGAQQVSYGLQNTGITTGTATPYLTNGSSSTAPQAAVPGDGSGPFPRHLHHQAIGAAMRAAASGPRNTVSWKPGLLTQTNSAC
jgi:hypothetical protein